jgi:tRNA A37 threonylcarbamoyladenosine synthetase subunit TsaC/SUA5/YrdC
MNISQEYRILRENALSGNFPELRVLAQGLESWWDLEKTPDALQATKQAVNTNDAVAICLGAVYALIADAREPQSVSRVRDIKERYGNNKWFAVLMSLDEIRQIINHDQVNAQVTSFLEEQDIGKIFGAKGFLRIPVKDNVGLAADYLSPGNYLQVFSFQGDPVAFKYEQGLRDSLKHKHPDGRGEILCTSFNLTGEPSITDDLEATLFAVFSGIKTIIHRSSSPRTGSYSIYKFSKKGVKKIRHGTGSDIIDRYLKTSV